MQLRRVLPGRRETKFAVALVMALTLLYTGVAIAGGGFSSGSGGWSSPLTIEWLARGLGNVIVQGETLLVTAFASGKAPALCQNNGGNIAPGQLNVNVKGNSSGEAPITRNGRASGETGGILPGFVGDPPEWFEAGCPNSGWTVVGLDATRVDWDTVFVEGERADGSTFSMTLTCFTSIRKNGTTFGTCVKD